LSLHGAIGLVQFYSVFYHLASHIHQ
jgi:hypothetical protein